MHGMVEHLAVSFAGVLGAVHGNLGVAENVLCVCAAVEGNTDAYRKHNLLTVEVERNGQFLLNALSNANGIAGIMKFLNEHGELIPAGAGQSAFAGEGFRVLTDRGSRDSVDCAEAGGETLCDLDQQAIAGGVAQTVVEDLELVDVNK